MASDSAHALFHLSKSLSRSGGLRLGTQLRIGNRELIIGSTGDPLEREIYNIPIEPGKIYVDGKGGFKRVFRLPDGKAMAIPNLDALSFSHPEAAESYAAIWERAVNEEKEYSRRARAAGLEAQDIEIEFLHINEHTLPVMVMPSFARLSEEGLQVRDYKSPHSSCGHSMLFGTPQNLEDPDYFRSIIHPLLDDAALAITHNLSFGSDTCNLAILDTAETPAHDRSTLELFNHRKQKLRLFFFDFSSKTGPRNDSNLELLDEQGNVDKLFINICAGGYVSLAFCALRAAIRDDEIECILALKKDCSSPHDYQDEYTLRDVIDNHFKSMKEEFRTYITDKVVENVQAMKESPERLNNTYWTTRTANGNLQHHR